MASDIAIVGGGLVGGTLALALARIGVTVALIDAEARGTHADPDFDGRAYALAHGSVRLLRGIGLWDDLADAAQEIKEIKVTDGRPGEGAAPFLLHFDGAELDDGAMGMMVEDRHLRPALIAALEAAPGVTHLTGTRVVSQTVAGPLVAVDIEDGQRIEAALVIGADGRGSGVGARAGISRIETGYGQHAIVCGIAHDAPHGGVAHQLFLPSGPLAILPLRENRSSIVWAETSENAARILALGPEPFLDELRPRFGSFLGDIALSGERFSYPLGLSLARRFVAGRVALAGDAAHGVHPLAGQGLNAGLKDVGVLEDVIATARARGEDIGGVATLRRYEQWRRFDAVSLALATDGINRVFSNDNALMRIGRDLGLGLVSALPGLRRRFMREAAGLTGDLPRLMRA